MNQDPTKRPFGLYVIIVLQVLNMLDAVGALIRVQTGAATLALPNTQNAWSLTAFYSLIAVMLALIIVGLWRFNYWAWFGTMIVTGIGLIIGIWQYVHGGSPYASLFINSLIVLYLNQSDLRRRFEGQLGQTVIV